MYSVFTQERRQQEGRDTARIRRLNFHQPAHSPHAAVASPVIHVHHDSAGDSAKAARSIRRVSSWISTAVYASADRQAEEARGQQATHARGARFWPVKRYEEERTRIIETLDRQSRELPSREPYAGGNLANVQRDVCKSKHIGATIRHKPKLESARINDSISRQGTLFVSRPLPALPPSSHDSTLLMTSQSTWRFSGGPSTERPSTYRLMGDPYASKSTFFHPATSSLPPLSSPRPPLPFVCSTARLSSPLSSTVMAMTTSSLCWPPTEPCKEADSVEKQLLRKGYRKYVRRGEREAESPPGPALATAQPFVQLDPTSLLERKPDRDKHLHGDFKTIVARRKTDAHLKSQRTSAIIASRPAQLRDSLLDEEDDLLDVLDDGWVGERESVRGRGGRALSMSTSITGGGLPPHSGMTTTSMSTKSRRRTYFKSLQSFALGGALTPAKPSEALEDSQRRGARKLLSKLTSAR
ncbi:unnamed protein product [Vitrella brassicaformis CCMP3155]|uniref:Uncharacterized protein n=2 Tax=Vitrella brassicaformis TaxID=1169539 RepID=A0A0G4EU27_VITBC|nr:unnamed protein product [Vitrella brassicaformis CCMP3155]|eukprot:CEM01578.1 unnamed protein product [Vitrella brassicaformis CCMP3155]